MTKIWIAFFLNLGFSLFELIGGVVTGSVAILSDALHDGLDAFSIGISCLLEKKSRKGPDETHTYGYGRYSVLGGLLTTVLLLLGSVFMLLSAGRRLFVPAKINYNGMLMVAIVGLCVNLGGALLTREGESMNQRAVNLHILEDVLGWAVVLVGAVVMKLADIPWLDPVLSIAVSAFIFFKATGNLKQIGNLFLKKTPDGICLEEVRSQLKQIPGVLDVHHVHLWSMDGQENYGTMHIVTDRDPGEMKGQIREVLGRQGVGHVTLELETPEEECTQRHCRVSHSHHHPHGHHHH